MHKPFEVPPNALARLKMLFDPKRYSSDRSLETFERTQEVGNRRVPYDRSQELSDLDND